MIRMCKYNERREKKKEARLFFLPSRILYSSFTTNLL